MKRLDTRNILGRSVVKGATGTKTNGAKNNEEAAGIEKKEENTQECYPKVMTTRAIWAVL